MAKAEPKTLDKTITVKLPAGLLKKLKVKSEETGVSISFVVRRALEEWVKEKK